MKLIDTIINHLMRRKITSTYEKERVSGQFAAFYDNNKLFIYVLAAYILIRLILLNTNYTEWGDTFRMIRGADYLSHLTWPWDEKRWPFYSVLLIPGILMNVPVLWGRFLGVFISAGFFVFVYLLYLKFAHDFAHAKQRSDLSGADFAHAKQRSDLSGADFEKQTILTGKWFHFFKPTQEDPVKFAILAAAVVATTSVFAYWNLRVMADPAFALMVLIYTYFFIFEYQKDIRTINPTKICLAILLLLITMTRLEGLFLLFSTMLYFVIDSSRTLVRSNEKNITKQRTDSSEADFLMSKNPRQMVLYLIPQVLIYFPWTIYAKVLYKGTVDNDYLAEVSGFVFNFQRVEYFLTYTLFILVLPVLSYFIYYGIKSVFKDVKTAPVSVSLVYIPLVMFVMQELLIGFIWTPSLPRIYMPIIAFAGIVAVYGIQKFYWLKDKKLRISFLWINLILLGLFAVLQYKEKLYFLGASKILFGLIILFDFLIVFGIYGLFINSKKNLAILILIINVLISSVVIYNQKDIYKTVKMGSDYVIQTGGKAAYSDESGTLSWYLKDKDKSLYLPADKYFQEPASQYYYLKQNNVQYLVWTNEFNRGSTFIDPKNDSHYQVQAVYTTKIEDLLEVILSDFGIMQRDAAQMFVTKVYRVN